MKISTCIAVVLALASASLATQEAEADQICTLQHRKVRNTYSCADTECACTDECILQNGECAQGCGDSVNCTENGCWCAPACLPPNGPGCPCTATTTTTPSKMLGSNRLASASCQSPDYFLQKGTAYLQSTSRLQPSEECLPCGPNASRQNPDIPCCIDLYLGKELYLFPSDENISKLPVLCPKSENEQAVLVYYVGIEAFFDKNLIEELNKMPFEGYDARKAYMDGLREQGIYSASQLASVDTERLMVSGNYNPMESAALRGATNSERAQQLTKLDQAAESKSASKNGLFTAEEEKIIKQKEALMDEQMQQAVQRREQAEKEVKGLQEAQAALVKAGRENLSSEAQAEAAKLQANIDSLQLEISDLSMEAERLQGEKYLARGGYLSGETVSTRQLILRNGMFNGVIVGSSILSENRRAVVEFKSEQQQLSDTELSLQVSFNPVSQTREFILESLNSSDIQSANRVVDSFGTSAFHNSQRSGSAGVSAKIPGVASFGMGGASSSSTSDGSAASGGSSSDDRLRSTSKSFFKSEYLWEPKALIIVDRGMLQASPAFSKATLTLEVYLNMSTNTTNHSQIATLEVLKLFADFGTHICPRALLGGYSRSDISVVSEKESSTSDLSRIASEASLEASSKGSSANFGTKGMLVEEGIPIIAAMDAEGKKGSASEEAWKQASAAASKYAAATWQSQANVIQMWKGGNSGLSVAEWRQSIDANSNWRIIDRFLSSCSGIWNFVDNTQLAHTMCQTWLSAYSHNWTLAAKELAEVSCSGGAGEALSRDMEIAVKEAERRQALERNKAACQEQAGMHWDAQVERCVKNVCTCDGHTGTTGTACLIDGSEKCDPSQLAKCNDMSCPQGYYKDAATVQNFCSSWRCNPNLAADVESCCLEISYTSNFYVKIKSSSDSVEGEVNRVKIYVNIKSSTDDQETGKTYLTSEFPKDSEVGFSNIRSSAPMYATDVCLWVEKDRIAEDKWKPTWVKIYNQNGMDSPNDESMLIGKASVWAEFNNDRTYQCKSLTLPTVAGFKS